MRNTHGKPECGTSRLRGGFTLLEVLIAMALSVMLITGVYGAIDLHFKYQVAGRAEIRGVQLMRGITAYANHDFNSIVMHVPVQSGTTAAADEAAAAEDTGEAAPVEEEPVPVTISESSDPLAFGLFGTNTFLHLTVSVPSRKLSTTGLYDGDLTGRLSDLMIVTYGMCTIDPLNMQILQRDLQVTRPEQGMARREVDMYNRAAATDLIGPEGLLAAEITEITFEYFDGTNWTGTWDSKTSGTLPTAVKFRMGIWNPPPRTNNRAGSPTATATISYVERIYHVPTGIPISVSSAATAPATTP